MLPEAGARPPDFFAELLRDQAPLFGLALAPDVVETLSIYLAELDRSRRRTNLTGPFDSPELVSHALESGLGQQLISHGKRIIDIGSGAGFPGLPLAIARPDLTVTLLEPRKKRAGFLRDVLERLALANASVLEKRVQSLDSPAYEVATVRAVGDLPAALERGRFLVPGGQLLAWTTEADSLSGALTGSFELRQILRVPFAARRVIASFQKL